MAKTAHQQKLERLQELKDLIQLELKGDNPSKLYLMDLRQSIENLEIDIDRLAIRSGGYEMVN